MKFDELEQSSDFDLLRTDDIRATVDVLAMITAELQQRFAIDARNLTFWSDGFKYSLQDNKPNAIYSYE